MTMSIYQPPDPWLDNVIARCNETLIIADQIEAAPALVAQLRVELASLDRPNRNGKAQPRQRAYLF